jgi:hypothetical protein
MIRTYNLMLLPFIIVNSLIIWLMVDFSAFLLVLVFQLIIAACLLPVAYYFHKRLVVSLERVSTSDSEY